MEYRNIKIIEMCLKQLLFETDMQIMSCETFRWNKMTRYVNIQYVLNRLSVKTRFIILISNVALIEIIIKSIFRCDNYYKYNEHFKTNYSYVILN